MCNSYFSFPNGNHILSFRKQTSNDGIPLLRNYRSHAQKYYEQFAISHELSNEWRAIPAIPWNNLSICEIAVHATFGENGVVVCDIQDFVQRYPDQTNKYFFSHYSQKKSTISLLVDSCWNKGIVILVSRDVHVRDIIDLGDLADSYGSFVFEKITIIVEAGASVIIHDTLRSRNNKPLYVFRSIECFLEENATCVFVHDQQWDQSVYDFSHITFSLSCNSLLHSCFVCTGSLLTKMVLDISLNGQSAQATLFGNYALNANQYVDIQTVQKHNASFTKSSVIVNGVVCNKAHAKHYSTICIENEGRQSHAFQKDAFIILDEGAKVSAKPSLQVLHDDVQCMHGSAIGQLDEEHLLYLQSRGLSKEQARKILLESFFSRTLFGVQQIKKRKELCFRLVEKLL